MQAKPRVRRTPKKQTRSAQARLPLGDGFTNFVNNLGVGQDNSLSAAKYRLTNTLSWDRETLDTMVRQSWIIRRCVSVVAEDMVRERIDIDCPSLAPTEIDLLYTAMDELEIWERLEEAITWGRLYGGAAAIPLISGQDFQYPVRPDCVGRGQFRGVYVLDRWTLWPEPQRLIGEFGPNYGYPEYYRVGTGNASGLDDAIVHHSRVYRFIGNKLPFWQRIQDLWWGQSVVEPLYDILVSFDTATFACAQLLDKAYLRVLKTPGLTEIMAGNIDAQRALLNQVAFMRSTQSIEAITMIDAAALRPVAQRDVGDGGK